MKFFKNHIAIIAFVSLFSCSENNTVLNEEFTVSLGTSIHIENNGETLNLEFKSVEEYSICPENVECVWAGRARLKIVLNNNQTFLIGLLDDENPFKITAQNYEVTLINVIPKGEGENSTYDAVFIVKEIEL